MSPEQLQQMREIVDQKVKISGSGFHIILDSGPTAAAVAVAVEHKRRADAAERELARQVAEARNVLASALDRHVKDESLYALAVIAINAIHWRDCTIADLKGQIRGLETQWNDTDAGTTIYFVAAERADGQMPGPEKATCRSADDPGSHFFFIYPKDADRWRSLVQEGLTTRYALFSTTTRYALFSATVSGIRKVETEKTKETENEPVAQASAAAPDDPDRFWCPKCGWGPPCICMVLALAGKDKTAPPRQEKGQG